MTEYKMELPDDAKHWLTVHDKLVKRLQYLFILLAVISVLGLVEGNKRFPELHERYSLMQSFLLSLESPNKYQSLLIKAYKASNAKELEAIPIVKRIPIERIGPLHNDVESYIQKQTRPDLLSFKGYSLSRVSYVRLIQWGPIVLLVVMLYSLIQIRKLHIILKPWAISGGDVQRKLNSIFYERVTTHYGEGFYVHVLLASLVILVIVYAGAVVFSVDWIATIDTQIAVDTNGNIHVPTNWALSAPVIIRPENLRPTGAFEALATFSGLWITFVVVLCRFPKYIKKHPLRHDK
jgi:hypothetical protein